VVTGNVTEMDGHMTTDNHWVLNVAIFEVATFIKVNVWRDGYRYDGWNGYFQSPRGAATLLVLATLLTLAAATVQSTEDQEIVYAAINNDVNNVNMVVDEWRIKPVGKDH
jgi:hypothetical protein